MKMPGRFAPCLDLIPIALAVALSFWFTVEVPLSDDWVLVPTLQKMHDGTLDWKALDTPYMGHKMDVSCALMGSVAVLTHWNSYVFRVINLLFLIGAWMAIRPIALREGRLLEAAIFFWSWNQCVNWIWTWNLACSMAVFCVLWSLRLLTSDHRYRNFVLAMVLSILGTFSYGAGLGVWPAAAYLLFFLPRPPLQRVIFGIVLVLAAWLFEQHQPPRMAQAENYFQMPVYILSALGAPVGFGTKCISAYVALIGLLMLAFSASSLKTRPFVASLLLASLAMMGLLMLARGGSDPLVMATDSRYGTMCALFWVALALAVDWTGWKKGVLMLLLALCLVRSLSKLPGLIAFKQKQLTAVQGIIASTPDRFTVNSGHVEPAQFDADIRLMHDWHYSLFRNR
jgi:hypothetical protein